MRRTLERARLAPLFVRSCVLLAGIRIGFHFFPLRMVRAWLWDFTGASVPLWKDRRSELQILRAVSAAEKYSPLRTTCLAVALLAQALLEHHGYKSHLRIGVRRDAKGEFFAHAWLEREGKIVIGGPLSMVQNYTALPEMEHLIA